MLPICKPLDDFRGQRSQNETDGIAEERVPKTVNTLEMLEQQDQLLHVIRSQLPVHVVQWMGNRMMNSSACQIFLKFVNVSSNFLDLGVLGFIQVPQEQVNPHAVVRKLGSHFLADKGVWMLADLQATVDPVVVREGDVSHPFLFQSAVQHLWIGVAIRKLEAAKIPFRRSFAEF